MDFNKWIYEGIPYVNERFHEKLVERQAENNINDYDPAEEKVEVNFHNDNSKALYNEVYLKVLDFICSEDETLDIGDVRRFIITAIINNISPEVRQTLYFDRDDKTWIITKVSPAERVKREEEAKTAKKTKLEDKAGFKIIWDALVKRQGVVVGHNCIIDIFFMMSHFGTDIPSDLKKCKALILKYFNELYDTKVLFNLYNKTREIENNATYLEAVYCRLNEEFGKSLPVRLADGFEKYDKDASAYHEAAYDSFITGCSFYWIKSYLGKLNEVAKNQIYWMRSLYKYIQVDGEDPFIFDDVLF